MTRKRARTTVPVSVPATATASVPPAVLVGLVLAVLAAVLAGCSQTPHPLVGTWELIEQEGRPVGAPHPVKIVTESHFAFGYPDATGVFAGGGTVDLAGDSYRETIVYHSEAFLVGRSLEFTDTVEDGLWRHSGAFDLEGSALRINEVWRRVER